MTTRNDARDLVLFDGACVLCDRTVRFIARRDRWSRYRFAPLHGAESHRLLDGLEPRAIDAVVLIEGDRAFTRSTAALRIARRLTWPYPLLSAFLVVPRPIRDAVYDWVARNRYRWFGKLEVCEVPAAAHPTQLSGASPVAETRAPSCT